VKRSFGKASAHSADEVPSNQKSKKPQVVPASPAVQTQQSSSCTPLPESPASQSCESGSWMPSSVSPTSQTCSDGSWAALQTRQGLCGHTPQVIAFPYVPPFPVSQIVQQPLGHSNTQTLVASPIETSTFKPSVAQQSQYPFLHGGFFHGSMGQMPIDRQQLTRALLEAMPDHYED